MDRWDQASWPDPATVALAMPEGMPAQPDGREKLNQAGVKLVEEPLYQGGVVSKAMLDADVVISGGVPIGAEVFNALRRTRLLLRPYIGYDDIDVDAATRQRILVANVPDTVPEDVANHTLALLLAANRKLRQMDRVVRTGAWARGGRSASLAAVAPIERLSELTLGLVGLGGIGRLVATRARPFGFRLLGFDPYVEPASMQPLDVQPTELDDLLKQADLVSVHVFLSPETHHLLDARRLALLKPGAYIVNTSRGPVIDEAALVERLRSGRLAGAALDVFETEPLPETSPLLALDTVTLSPHLANYSVGGVRALWLRTAEIALQVARGGLPERKVVINKPLLDELTTALGSARSNWV
ncbi:MAG: hypothetical protein JO023_18840 [Chloroflexi bacterium]|nr:hypothetical protein [Chloroflexota bacterium]